MAVTKSQAQVSMELYKDEQKKARTGDVKANELLTRIEASPVFVRLARTYGAEIGNSNYTPWAVDKHTNAVKIMKERFDANYDHNLDRDAMKFFESVDKAYAAQKPTPKFTDYTVEKNDTLSEIIERHYDLSGPTEIDTAYKAVARSNGITNPNVISEGQLIKLPETLPLTAAQIATTPSAKATPEEITKAVKLLQESVFGPEKDANGKKNPDVDGFLGPKTASELRKAHGDLNKDEDVDKLDDDLKAAVKTLRDNGHRGLFDQGKVVAAPTATPVPSASTPSATPAKKATPEEITKAVKTLQEGVFGPETDANGKKNPKVDGMFGPQTAAALRKQCGDLNKPENFDKLSDDAKAAVKTLRDNVGPGLFDQDKVIPRNLPTGRQKGATSNSFDWSAQAPTRDDYDKRLADFRASREGKPFNAEAETARLNERFAFRAGGEQPQTKVTPSPATPSVSSGTGLPLNPAKGGPGAFYN